ncbi:peptide/nickel transport system substrate-binding protein/glutathione transport system substrate-binding protein [Mobilisporobacter senegalensis]|uniref:Peptide/nickel transport system substrate-binding protein/glutathione transport system substrate-binding protein n=1 Tax=Mobilisporobacter senegalensis TaxID=1329262 RepID=A0A3N1X9K5_9FIRM|nr:ABC transporter substrate-binding protein [Mobilisporobacter senegalensis]ROR23436.1 peptide/nickel transport system substrate-binding protein/glutathione transport system substrate-binding protein [Mobilisporobacter senegalensis]
MKKRILALTLSLAIIGGLLSGCGNKTNDAKEDGTKTETKTETATEGDKYGGDLRIAAIEDPTTLFPPQAPDTGVSYYVSPAAEELGRLDADGAVSPWLAEEFITDADKLTYTIKLREGVKFHDGSALNAEVVKWNLDSMIANGKAAELGNPVSVEATDDLTVVVNFDTWSNNWDTIYGAVRVVSKQAYDDNGEEWCKTHVVGTGPFKFDSYTQGGSLKYIRNDEYRLEGQPYLDSVEFVMIPDANTQVSAFQNGEVDTIVTYDPVVMNTLSSQGYENIAQKNGNLANIKYVLINSKDTQKPLGKLEVRQAVMHAIDWENIAKSLSGGYGIASPLFATEDSWAYNPEATLYEYNTELAKKILAEAGYPDGFETVINTIEKNQDIAVALQACLQEIGIKAKINIMDSSEMSEKQKADNMEGFIMGNGSSQMDFTNNYIRLYSSEGIKNQGVMAFPEDYEKALFGAREAKTIEEKKELLQTASKMLVQDYALLFPVSVIFNNCFVQAGIKDVNLFQVSATQWTPEAVYKEK